jgi:hypothetical protein
MPIEIKELHIRVAVNSAAESKAPATQSPASGRQQSGGADQDSMITECVEQVLQILQDRSER